MRSIVKVLVEAHRIYDPVQMIPFEDLHPKMVNCRGMMCRQQCLGYPGW